MIFPSLDVIHIVFNFFVHHIMEHGRHGSLVGSTGVFETKGHDGVIKIVNWCAEGSLFSIFGGHADLIVATKPVHEGKHGMTGG